MRLGAPPVVRAGRGVFDDPRRGAPTRSHTIDSVLAAKHRKKNDAFVAPCSGDRAAFYVANYLRRAAAGHSDPLQLPFGEKRDKTAIRGPERKRRPVRRRKRLRLQPIEW